MKLKVVLLSCFLILVVASFTVASGSAETDEELQSRITSTEIKIESLNKEVEQLREELNEIKEMLKQSQSKDFLDEMIGIYEKEFEKEDEATPSKQQKWEKRENWRKLQRGMSKDEVRRILGEPEGINVYIDGRESWSYPGSGGSVFIYEGRVTAWSEPSFD